MWSPEPPQDAKLGRVRPFLSSSFLRLRSLLALLVVVLFAMTASGCASKPTMHLKHAEVSGVRLGFPPTVSVVMTLTVDVYNPNSYDVAIRGVRGTVVLQDRYSLPVDFKPGGEGVWLPSDSTTPVRVPITIPMDLAMTLLRETYTTPSIGFRLIGAADVTATRTFKIEKDNYSVDERGSVTRQQMELALRPF